MYGNSYGYWTGLSDLMINHMKKKVEWLKKSKKILKKSVLWILDCSDPTFLKLLKKVDKSLELFAVGHILMILLKLVLKEKKLIL